MNAASLGASLDDPLNRRLLLRREIQCSKHHVGEQIYYQLTDPLNGRVYRLGEREWEVVSRLDGTRSLRQVAKTLQRPDSQSAASLSDNDLLSLARWLNHTQLAAPETNTLLEESEPIRGKLPAWLNVAFLRIPLFNPDRLIKTLLPALRWTIAPAAIVFWAVFCGFSFAELLVHWTAFQRPISAILAPDNWLYLLISWILLKAIHELYHGLVCKRFGGHVPSCGLLLILFSPVAFVDVTSSWRFRSKWQRIYTSAAGMYAELFVAALAVHCWIQTEHGVAHQLSQNLITMASLSTLLFNGNFLMRFDGYYILSDLVDVQNLYANGQHYVRYFGRRYLLGLPASPLPSGARRPRLTKVYGVASLCWRITFYCGITLTAATMFHGAGIVIAFIICIGWLIIPTSRFIQKLCFGRGPEQPNRRHFITVMGGILATSGAVLLLPWPGGVVATGVVDYEPLTVVRAKSSGFLRDLACSPGKVVDAGSRLVQIENIPVEQELAEVRFELEQSQIRCRSLQSDGDYDLYQIEVARRDSLREQFAELEDKVAGLEVIAPVKGRVLGRELESRVGEFVASGETILSLGRENQKAILVAISQQDADQYLRQRGTTPYVRIRGRGVRIHGTKLDRINPRATRRLPHPALAATFGGPLPVSMGDQEHESPDEATPELIEPHFHAVIELAPNDAERLRAGELARVRLGTTGRSIGSHLSTAFQRWVSHRLGNP